MPSLEEIKLKHRISELEAQLAEREERILDLRFIEKELTDFNISLKLAIADRDLKLEAKDEQIEALQSSKASVDPHLNPNCNHNCSSKAHYDFVQCDGCGWVLQGRLANTGRYEKDDGRVWWPSRSHAEFFYKHGRYLSEQKES